MTDCIKENIYEKNLRMNKEIIRVSKKDVDEIFIDKVELYSIRYKSDEYEVEGYIAIPKIDKKIFPGLIYNRGGNREFGTISVPRICKIAQFGFCVMASQYRGNCGGTGKSDFGGNDVNDVINLINIMLELDFIDKNGVYMLGESSGGMMTYRACSMDNRIKAAVVKSGIADCVDMYNGREDGMKKVYHELVGGSPLELPDEFWKRSAVNWAERINMPLYICHGTSDKNVNVEQAYKMGEQLKKYNKDFKLVIYENEDHYLKGVKWLRDAMMWLKQYTEN